MDTVFAWINAAAFGLIAVTLTGLVLHPRVHDGVVIKAGLICMAFGFGSIALRMLDGLQPADLLGLARSLLLVNAGLAVVIAGYLWRRARVGHKVRRITDWADLEEPK